MFSSSRKRKMLQQCFIFSHSNLEYFVTIATGQATYQADENKTDLANGQLNLSKYLSCGRLQSKMIFFLFPNHLSSKNPCSLAPHYESIINFMSFKNCPLVKVFILALLFNSSLFVPALDYFKSSINSSPKFCFISA